MVPRCLARLLLPGLVLILLAGPAASEDAARRGVSITVVPEEVRAAEGFDAGQSAGLFVGVRKFDDDAFAEVPYAVDDAVDLAYLFAVELDLIAPERVVLSLAGEPRKTVSRERLRTLLGAGAKRGSAEQSDIYQLITEAGQRSRDRGLFVVTLATHGFRDQGIDYLVASDSLRRRITRTGIAVTDVFEDVARAAAPRRLVLLDACRERLFPSRAGGGGPAMSPTFAAAIAAASGQAVLAGATAGGFAYDDPERGNGVFTAAVLDGLRGEATADERSFITVRRLADFVDRRVADWVALHRPGHAERSHGIALQIDAVAVAEMPLAVDPAGLKRVENDRRRLDAAIVQLRRNIGGPISGAMFDEMTGILRSPETPREQWLALVGEIEALDGSERPQRSLRDWFREHRAALSGGLPPNPQPGDEWMEPMLGMRFRYVPPGTFQMGSPESEKGRDEDENLHTVTLTRGFWMGETEVTQGQWRELMGKNPSRFQDCGETCPVETVSWWDAAAYANRLSERAELESCYELDCVGSPGTKDYECTSVKLRSRSCEGFRLPTEAEWERAARAETLTATYAGDLTIRGNCDAPELEKIAWYCGNSERTTHPVGRKQANDWGLEDMLGNVYEWVEDADGPYGAGAQQDPLFEEGSLRVLRGGSWIEIAQHVRSAWRGAPSPGNRLFDLGFRLARGQGE